MPLKLNDQDINVMWSRNLNLSEVCAYKFACNRGTDKEIDIFEEDFLAWQKKHSHDGKSVTKRHFWRIYNNLCERGFGHIVRSGFGRIRLVIYSLDFVCGREGGDSTDLSQRAEGENKEPVNDAEQKTSPTRIEQQQLIYADKKTKEAGIVIQKENLWKIAKYPAELINRAIRCFKAADLTQSTHIRNPAGWLISCLENKYYLSYRFEKVQASMEQKYFQLQECILDTCGSLPRRYPSGTGFGKKNTTPHST